MWYKAKVDGKRFPVLSTSGFLTDVVNCYLYQRSSALNSTIKCFLLVFWTIPLVYMFLPFWMTTAIPLSWIKSVTFCFWYPSHPQYRLFTTEELRFSHEFWTYYLSMSIRPFLYLVNKIALHLAVGVLESRWHDHVSAYRPVFILETLAYNKTGFVSQIV